MLIRPIEKQTALVTGCSSGIGLATARCLRDAGWRVAPTARSEKDLQSLRNEGFAPILLDVTDSESIRNAVDEVLQRFDGQLGALINNAGFGMTAAMEDTTREMMRSVFEVNVFGLQELTNQLLPIFRQQAYGRILNVSSVLGVVALPLAGAYSASKFAVEAVTDAMRRELFDSGIGITLIEPGPIDSDFTKNLAHRSSQFCPNPSSVFYSYYIGAIEARKNGTAKRTAGCFMKPPEYVAQIILKCLKKSKPPSRVRVTIVTHALALLTRTLPTGWLDALFIRGLRKRLR